MYEYLASWGHFKDATRRWLTKMQNVRFTDNTASSSCGIFLTLTPEVFCIFEMNDNNTTRRGQRSAQKGLKNQSRFQKKKKKKVGRAPVTMVTTQVVISGVPARGKSLFYFYKVCTTGLWRLFTCKIRVQWSAGRFQGTGAFRETPANAPGFLRISAQ